MCLCGDTRCWSCGPAQGNSRCSICGVWEDEGGCKDPEYCVREADAWAEDEVQWLAERDALAAEYRAEVERDRLMEQEKEDDEEMDRERDAATASSVGAVEPSMIARLRALLVEATPLPWAENERGGTMGEPRIESRDEHGAVNDGWCIAETFGSEDEANAALIVAAVNALPALLDAAEERNRLARVEDAARALLAAIDVVDADMAAYTPPPGHHTHVCDPKAAALRAALVGAKGNDRG